MQFLYWILLLILLLTLAGLAVYLSINRPTVKPQALSTLVSVPGTRGSGEYDLTREIIHRLEPYLHSVPDSLKQLDQYLRYHYGNLPLSKQPKEEDLRDLIESICREHKISTVVEFIDKSGLSYMTFLPNNKKILLLESLKESSTSPADRDRVTDLLKQYLREENVSTSDASTLTGDILKYYRLYKFRDSVAKETNVKIKKRIKGDPLSVFELDLLGMMPRIQRVAHDYALEKNQSKGSQESLEKIRKYLEELDFLDRYSVYLPHILTLDELESKLHQAAERRESHARNREVHARQREIAAREREIAARRREVEAQQRRERHISESDLEREARMREAEAHQREMEARQRELEARHREKETETDRQHEEDLERAFYERLREDPELEDVAAALGMSLHDLFEQYKQEAAITSPSGSAETIVQVGGSGPMYSNINQRAVEALKQKLMQRLTFKH
jgi:hypothetical protein